MASALRPRAWWTSRAASAVATLWFLGFVAVVPFGNLHTDGVPVPWQGRLYMVCLSLAFATIVAGAFWSLGRSQTREYFGQTRVDPQPA